MSVAKLNDLSSIPGIYRKMPSVHKSEDFFGESALFAFAVMMMVVVVATMALLLLLFCFWSLVLCGPGGP